MMINGEVVDVMNKDTQCFLGVEWDLVIRYFVIIAVVLSFFREK